MQATETTKLNYTMRKMVRADIPAVVAFLNKLKELEQLEHGSSVTEFAQDWDAPDQPYVSRLLAILVDADQSEGELVSYGLMIKMPESKHAWGRLRTLPAYRQQGIGSRVYGELEQLARQAGATEFWMEPDQQASLALRFFAQRGFVVDRQNWFLRLPADQSVAQPQLADGYTIRTYVKGQDEDLLLYASNTSFADHYGFIPDTAEQIAHNTSEEDFDDHQRIYFAFSPAGEIAGYCWSGFSADEIARRGERVGWIYSLGVIPAHRRHGLGRALLLSSIGWLRQHVALVELGVEGKNEKALPLYYSVGFQQYKGMVNLIKPLT